MVQKTFFFLSLPLKPKRSSTILLFLSFSHESSMSECVKKNRRVFLCWVGRLTIACRVDYLHKGVLDNDGWNGHHHQAHIFLEKRIVIFFFPCSFFCLLVLVSSSSFLVTSQDDAYDSTSLSGSRERFYDERECDIFQSSLSSKSQRPRDKKQHCHLRFADVLLLKKKILKSP